MTDKCQHCTDHYFGWFVGKIHGPFVKAVTRYSVYKCCMCGATGCPDPQYWWGWATIDLANIHIEDPQPGRIRRIVPIE